MSIVGGAGNTSAPYPTLSLYVTSADPIVAKTYTATALEAGSFYFVDASTNFISDVDFTVNITSISDTEIKGTFSGKVGQGSAAKTVSEGVFSAKFY